MATKKGTKRGPYVKKTKLSRDQLELIVQIILKEIKEDKLREAQASSG
jgi:hypothetical protein